MTSSRVALLLVGCITLLAAGACQKQETMRDEDFTLDTCDGFHSREPHPADPAAPGMKPHLAPGPSEEENIPPENWRELVPPGCDDPQMFDWRNFKP